MNLCQGSVIRGSLGLIIFNLPNLLGLVIELDLACYSLLGFGQLRSFRVYHFHSSKLGLVIELDHICDSLSGFSNLRSLRVHPVHSPKSC